MGFVRTVIEAAEEVADTRTNQARERFKQKRREFLRASDWNELPERERQTLFMLLPGSHISAAMNMLNSAAVLFAPKDSPEYASSKKLVVELLRDIVGNPFRVSRFAFAWRTSTALALTKQMYESRDFSAMPILADALQDAGCEDEDILSHCRGPGPHVRGCWVCDLVLVKK